MTAIWEYDPTQADNHVLGGSLDVITAIRTLAIKVTFLVSLGLHTLSYNIYAQIQASGQHIECFNSTQICCGIPEALKIPLHSNICWGTAYKMLNQAYKLWMVQSLFLSQSYIVDKYHSQLNYS